jgi:hypothetical protein
MEAVLVALIVGVIGPLLALIYKDSRDAKKSSAEAKRQLTQNHHQDPENPTIVDRLDIIEHLVISHVRDPEAHRSHR